MTPCGVPGGDATTCAQCADDCACAGHDGRVCLGGAHACTCRTPLDVDAFKAWARMIGYAPSTVDNAAARIRRLVEAGITTDDAIEGRFPTHMASSRHRLRTYLHMYQDFMKQTGRSA